MASTPRGPALSPELILHAYTLGAFPMADPDDGSISWYAPDPRAILPLDRFRVPKNLDKVVRSERFEVGSDTDFEAVIRACAAPRRDAPETWISEPLLTAYLGLHRMGFAHSVESYRAGRLVGGLYGVALGAAFFGESMFYREPDASKVALVHLVFHLLRCGFQLLDIQMLTPHMERLGAIEIPRARYQHLLRSALAERATWSDLERSTPTASKPNPSRSTSE